MSVRVVGLSEKTRLTVQRMVNEQLVVEEFQRQLGIETDVPDSGA